jgi:acyl carrier protein
MEDRYSDVAVHEIKNVSDIEEILLRLVKKGCGQDPGFTPTATTVPQNDIKGFDSLTTLEVLTELEEETGIHADEDVFYVDLKPRQYLPLRSVAAAIWDKIFGRGEKNA